jgi:hypothetical protein
MLFIISLHTSLHAKTKPPSAYSKQLEERKNVGVYSLGAADRSELGCTGSTQK